MRLIIDRFEDEYAVCENENKESINIDRDKLPSDIKEGDIIWFEDDIVTKDQDYIVNRKKYIEEITKDIWK